MKKTSSFLICTAFLLTALTARANLFTFAYTFHNGYVASGTLEGTRNGDYVENVTNVSLFLRGVEITGPIYAGKYTPTAFLAGPVVSFDATLNNFIFANSDFVNGDDSADATFYLIDNVLNFGSLASAATLHHGVVDLGEEFPVAPSHWSLVEVSVPDAGSTLALIGLPLLLLGALRRRSQAP